MLSESQVLQQIRCLDPKTDRDQRCDIWVRDGQIQSLDLTAIALDQLPSNTVWINGSNLILAPGLVDLYSYSGEPGLEDRETLVSLMSAAWAGGFTQIGILPHTQPVLDQPAILALLQDKLAQLNQMTLPKIRFWGSLTLGEKGEQLSELGELAQAGVQGFMTHKPLENLALLRRALEYLQPLGKPLALVPINSSLQGNGVMREGPAAIRLGLPSEPEMAETTAIATILEMVGEYRTPVHFMRLSTARGVDLVAQGKAQQLPITASVNWMHLLWNTDQLESYDPNLRLAPPLGNETDRLALIQGLKSGIIDAIAVDHRAYTYEEKTLAFAEAPPGAIGLELALPCLWQGLVTTGMLTALGLWQALSLHSCHCWGLNSDEPTARYVLFDPQAVWTVDGTNLKTLGRNTPYLGQTLQGKVQNIFLAPQLERVINQQF